MHKIDRRIFLRGFFIFIKRSSVGSTLAVNNNLTIRRRRLSLG